MKINSPVVFCFAFLLFAICAPVTAQDTVTFQGAKVLSLPKPDYPKEARETGLAGKVSVLVSIDESGNVTAADKANGPDSVCLAVTAIDVLALRNAAKDAALNAKFSPAVKDGEAVKSTLWLNYEFGKRKPKQEDIPAAAEEPYSVTPPPDVATPRTSGVSPHPNVSATPPPDSAGSPADSATPPPDYVGPVKGSENRFTAVGDEYVGGPRSVNGGVLNGKAISLPKPPYPPAARAVRASGAVSIQVLIETDGSIRTAEAVSGHPLLRASARHAACSARFMPVQLSGQPVKVSGIITYNFVP